MSICIYKQICLNECVCIYLCVCARACVSVPVSVYVYIYIYMPAHVCLHTTYLLLHTSDNHCNFLLSRFDYVGLGPVSSPTDAFFQNVHVLSRVDCVGKVSSLVVDESDMDGPTVVAGGQTNEPHAT